MGTRRQAVPVTILMRRQARADGGQPRHEWRLRDGHHPQQRAIFFIGQNVEQSVRTLVHVADALTEFPEKRIAADRKATHVEDDALDLFANQPAHEQAAFPFREPVSRVEGEAGQRDRKSAQNRTGCSMP